jgi:hypothetical protein
VQNIEDHQARRRLVPRPRHRATCASAQAATQPLKVGAALLVEADQFAVEQCGRGEDIGQAAQLRELGRAIPARARAQRHASAVHSGLGPHAVPFDLKGPVGRVRDRIGRAEQHRRDEVRQRLGGRHVEGAYGRRRGRFHRLLPG